MDVLPQTLLFIGIIPALILLFISLKGYDDYYKDKIVFLTFISGIIAGFISNIIEWFTSAGIGIWFIILFPVLEQLFKTIILNISRFHGKKETVVYGLSLGLGFGSIFTPFSIILTEIQGGNDYFVLLVAIGSLGIILAHAATGISIAYGVYKYKMRKYLMFSILFYIPVTATIFITAFYNIGYLQVILVAYGLILYWYATKKIMPRILEKNKKEEYSNKK
ncbi:MAG: protease PrsW [Thermoplasmatales archaeon SG8-52-3]|nr:MAG: protease PrsW [Thermoplasmatales archaeon SG8-52-3]